MINHSEIPKILVKIDTLVNAYAHLCGVEHHIAYEYCALKGCDICYINWESVFEDRALISAAFKKMTVHDCLTYVEENHPLYLQAINIRSSLLERPDWFMPEDLKFLNDIWHQMQLLMEDGSIKDHVMKTIDIALLDKLMEERKRSASTTQAHAPLHDPHE